MTSGGQLQHFIDQTQKITTSQSDLTLILGHLQQWRQNFARDLKSIRFDASGFQYDSALAKHISSMNNQIEQQIQLWDVKWAELDAAQSVAVQQHKTTIPNLNIRQIN